MTPLEIGNVESIIGGGVVVGTGVVDAASTVLPVFDPSVTVLPETGVEPVPAVSVANVPSEEAPPPGVVAAGAAGDVAASVGATVELDSSSPVPFATT